ncbi:hypothetical protein A0J61_10413, partial [Choanephora cucurbitarum]
DILRPYLTECYCSGYTTNSIDLVATLMRSISWSEE